MPGHHTDNNANMDFMNVMCDMSYLVVVFSVPDENTVTLVSHFMQHVLMKFGLCHLVVLDGTPLKKALIAIYQALNLKYDILAKRNHKGLSVEHVHRF